jgi:prepilin-type N-terminal cleavage/methylation domain-containing protein
MRTRGKAGKRGVTLMEVLIAVSLVSILSVGILMAMRVGLGALTKANNRLMDNRKVAGTQRILEQQLFGLIPVTTQCLANPEGPKGGPMAFFDGEPRAMRFVSGYSLHESWRGMPRILEFLVIPGDPAGVRLVVNEIPYWGPVSAGILCMGLMPDPVLGVGVPRFAPVQAGPASFVLADHLAFCRFAYLERKIPPLPDVWQQQWILPKYPAAIRIEMGPLAEDQARLRPLTITASVHVNRSADIQYGDYMQ